jgi:hypothetical protein
MRGLTMADEILILGFTVDFWYNAIFAFIDIFFGVMLFYIDSRSKRRQDMTLKRQDESLDIMLEQVSKVNTFQTRVLSYAIETLEKDMEEIKMIIETKVPTKVEEPIGEEPKPVEAPTTTTTPTSLGQAISDRFQSMLRDQLSGMMDGIKKNLEGIPGVDENESYRVKKGLEFDLKHLVRGLEGLEDLKEEKTKREADSRAQKSKREALLKKEMDRKKARGEDIEVFEPGYDIMDTVEGVTERDEEEIARKSVIKDTNKEMEYLESLNDWKSFASSILESVGKSIDLSIDRDTDVDGLKKDLKEMKREKELYKQKRRELRKKSREQREKKARK